MKKNNIFFTLLLVYVLFSCQSNEIKYSSVLFATDDYLSFPIDDETRLPYSVLTFKNEDREYLSFSNDWKEILAIYDFVTKEVRELSEKSEV